MRARKQLWHWPAALLLAAASLASGPPVQAQSHPAPQVVRVHQGSMGWNELSPARQQALAPLQADWKTMEPDRQKKWLVIADKFAGMDAGQQARAQGRMREWVALRPEQRRLARESFLQAKKLDPAQKNAKWERYQQLPDAEKQKLAEAAARKKRLAALPALPKPAPSAAQPPAGKP
jgi:hypothetical protein